MTGVKTSIRRASVSDEASARAVIAEYNEAVGVVVRDDAASFRAYLDGPGALWLARTGDEVVGCVVMRPITGVEPGACEVKRLYVRPAHRGYGLAAALMDTLERFAFREGFRAVYLDTFEELADAVRFYERRGYERVARYNDNPQATIFMRRTLARPQPLQNRVMPTGEIVALPGRGLVMGNRGVLHDGRRRIVRATQVKRWIACRLAFRGRHRTVMTPRSWTELFFLDEATAFAAGHRPCAECRHADYKRFRALWETCFGAPAGADAIDAVLHAERLDGRAKRTWRADVASLPDGAYVSVDGVARIVWDGELVAWRDGGYGERQTRPAHRDVDVLTPPSIVAVFKAGYRPAVHPSL